MGITVMLTALGQHANQATVYSIVKNAGRIADKMKTGFKRIMVALAVRVIFTMHK
jgi:hypothetical protein